VTLSGIETLGRFESFVNRVSEPMRSVPAVADPGTVAEIVSAPDPWLGTANVEGLTENAVPVVAAEIASEPPPPFETMSVCVAAGAPHPVGPNEMAPRDANEAIAAPPCEGAEPASPLADSATAVTDSDVESCDESRAASASTDASAGSAPPPVSLDLTELSSPLPQPATPTTELAQANAAARPKASGA
jgi:hypothetical protein